MTDEANLHSPFSSAALPWGRWQGIAVRSWVLPGGSAGRAAARRAELSFRCEAPTLFHSSASGGQRPRNSGRGPSLLLSAWPREHALELFSADAKLAVAVVMSSPLFIARHNLAEKCFVLIPQTKRAMDQNGSFFFSLFWSLDEAPTWQAFHLSCLLQSILTKMVHTDLWVTLRGLALAVTLNWSLSTPVIITVLLILELWPPWHS